MCPAMGGRLVDGAGVVLASDTDGCARGSNDLLSSASQ